jgi:hypothetical protein
VDERHSHHVNSYSFSNLITFVGNLSYCSRGQAGFGFISFWFLVRLCGLAKWGEALVRQAHE